MGITELTESDLDLKLRQKLFVHAHAINEHKACTNHRMNVHRRHAAVQRSFIHKQ
jgi:hypothetical protein